MCVLWKSYSKYSAKCDTLASEHVVWQRVKSVSLNYLSEKVSEISAIKHKNTKKSIKQKIAQIKIVKKTVWTLEIAENPEVPSWENQVSKVNKV